jgi:hypothetical protein
MCFSKIRLFIIKYKLQQIALLIITIAFLVLFFTQFILPSGSFYQTEYVSIWGTLFGAVIGGGFTLLGTQFASQKEIQGRFYIKQKNEILSPLYDELKEIHEVILFNNPYPLIVSFEKSSQTIVAHPQYAIWGKIKIDTRYFDTPKSLTIEMEKLYSAILNYRSYRPVAANAVVALTNEILLSKLGFTCPIINLGDSLLPYIAEGQINHLIKRADTLLFLGNEKTISNISEEDKIYTYKLILSKCNELPEIIEIKSLYSEWLGQEARTIELLRVLIESINYKYH